MGVCLCLLVLASVYVYLYWRVFMFMFVPVSEILSYADKNMGEKMVCSRRYLPELLALSGPAGKGGNLTNLSLCLYLKKRKA